MAVIVPEIFADAINEKLGVKLRLANLAYDATNDVAEIRQAGDTIHFPVFSNLTDAEELARGGELTLDEVTMTDTAAEIKHVGKAVEILDRDAVQVKGRVLSSYAEKIATAMAKKIDADLGAAIDADATLKFALTGSLDSSSLNAAIGLFGDDCDTDSFAGIVVNSRRTPEFYAMPEFVDKGKTYTTDGSGIVKDGIIGYFRGIPVVVADNATYEEATDETKTYIIKKDALGYVFQRDINIEQQRNILKKSTNVAADALYATKLLDVKGVVVARVNV